MEFDYGFTLPTAPNPAQAIQAAQSAAGQVVQQVAAPIISNIAQATGTLANLVAPIQIQAGATTAAAQQTSQQMQQALMTQLAGQTGALSEQSTAYLAQFGLTPGQTGLGGTLPVPTYQQQSIPTTASPAGQATPGVTGIPVTIGGSPFPAQVSGTAATSGPAAGAGQVRPLPPGAITTPTPVANDNTTTAPVGYHWIIRRTLRTRVLVEDTPQQDPAGQSPLPGFVAVWSCELNQWENIPDYELDLYQILPLSSAWEFVNCGIAAGVQPIPQPPGIVTVPVPLGGAVPPPGIVSAPGVFPRMPVGQQPPVVIQPGLPVGSVPAGGPPRGQPGAMVPPGLVVPPAILPGIVPIPGPGGQPQPLPVPGPIPPPAPPTPAPPPIPQPPVPGTDFPSAGAPQQPQYVSPYLPPGSQAIGYYPVDPTTGQYFPPGHYDLCQCIENNIRALCDCLVAVAQMLAKKSDENAYKPTTGDDIFDVVSGSMDQYKDKLEAYDPFMAALLESTSDQSLDDKIQGTDWWRVYSQ